MHVLEVSLDRFCLSVLSENVLQLLLNFMLSILIFIYRFSFQATLTWRIIKIWGLRAAISALYRLLDIC